MIDLATLAAFDPEDTVGTSGCDLDVTTLLDAIGMAGGGPGAFVLHPQQVGDVAIGLLAMMGEPVPEGEETLGGERATRLREVLSLDVAAARGAGAGLVGRLFGCDVWAWAGCGLVNEGADRMGFYIGERVVGVVSDA